jgi:ATP-dependent helicase/nuclease subunit A
MTQATAKIQLPANSAQAHISARAASPHYSLWVSASAGTGKTNILTRRVLGLLLHGVRPEKILCLTYTKAAAVEMAKRIQERLAAWVWQDEVALEKNITAIVGDAAYDPAMLHRARSLFARCLEVADGMKIQTIHAFCQGVLQRFPIEAGLVPNFQIADDQQSQALREAAMAEILPLPELQSSLDLLSEYCANPGMLQSLVQKFSQSRYAYNQAIAAHGGIEAMLAHSAKILGLSPPLTGDAFLAQNLADDVTPLAALRRAVPILLASSKITDRKCGAAIQGFLSLPMAARPDGFADYSTAFLTQEGTILKRLLTKEVIVPHPDIDALILAEAERVEKILHGFRHRQLLGLSHAALRLGHSFADRYRRHKQAQHVLDFNDLLEQTKNLLARPGIGPWILYKLDGGIDHILLDEAQDTSREQWDIIQALTADFFTGDSGRGPRSIFVVGDPKQSIYGFQGADPHSMQRMHSFYRECNFAAGQFWQDIALQQSYRSTMPVLQMVDSVFTASNAQSGVRYLNAAEVQRQNFLNEETIRHIPIRDAAPGIVEIWPKPPVAEKPEIDAWQTPDRQTARADNVQALAQIIARTIADWLRRGEMLPENTITGRPARPIHAGDIMILLPRRGGMMQALTQALKQHDVPVSGIDRLLIREHIAVMDILALARFTLLPEDDYNLACVLKSPLLSWPIDMTESWLFDLCHNRQHQSLWEQLQAMGGSRPEFAAAAQDLKTILNFTGTHTPHEFFSAVLYQQGGMNRLLARLGTECVEPIAELLNLCQQQSRNFPQLRGFISWIDTKAKEVKREMDQAGAQVRIMTVHAAKGLQAPIVFLPDTARRPHGQKQIADFLYDEDEKIILWPGSKDNLIGKIGQAWQQAEDDADAAEYHRLFYVALTRAEDRLYIATSSDKPQEQSWYHYACAAGAVAQECAMDFAAHGYAAWRGQGWRLQNSPMPDFIRTASDTAAPAQPPQGLFAPPPPEPVPNRPLRPSVFEAVPQESPLAQTADDRQSPAMRGTIIHRLLQTLPEVAAEKRQARAENYLQSLRPELPPSVRDEITAEVLQLLTHPEFAPFFKTGLVEAPIIGIYGDKVYSGQIDRLVITDADIWILDYKTTRNAPQHLTEIPDAYIRQMRTYRALVQAQFPRHRLQTGLLFTAVPRLFIVPAT